MSIAPAAPPTLAEDPRSPRVRHQVREAATVMAFSAATSAGVALLLLLLAVLVRQA